jgi:hypothetical protein
MKTIPLLLLGLFITGTKTQARIGETLDQCIDRYGPVIEKAHPALAGSDPEASVFSKSGITIITEFKDGVVWSMTFKKTALSSSEVASLLEANKTSGTWTTALKFGDSDYRISGDRSRIASFSLDKANSVGLLSISTQPYLDMNRVEFLSRTLAPKQVTTPKDVPKSLSGF